MVKISKIMMVTEQLEVGHPFVALEMIEDISLGHSNGPDSLKLVDLNLKAMRLAGLLQPSMFPDYYSAKNQSSISGSVENSFNLIIMQKSSIQELLRSETKNLSSFSQAQFCTLLVLLAVCREDHCAILDKSISDLNKFWQSSRLEKKSKWYRDFFRTYHDQLGRCFNKISKSQSKIIYDVLNRADTCQNIEISILLRYLVSKTARSSGDNLFHLHHCYDYKCIEITGGASSDIYLLAKWQSNPAQETVPIGLPRWKANFLAVKELYKLVKRLKNQSTEENRDTQIMKCADRFSSHLYALRGISNKLSTSTIPLMEVLPPELRQRILIQSNTRPVLSPEMARKIFEDSFAVKIDSIFSSWNDFPVSTGSFGQVHKAQLNTGEIVAVKIQYPNIHKIMSKNILGLKVLSPLFKAINPNLNTRNLSRVLNEDNLREIDYLAEAAIMKKVRNLLANDMDVVVPNVYSEFTSKTVLTMDYLNGLNMYQAKDLFDEKTLEYAANTIVRVSNSLAYSHGIINSDPHPLNFIFMKDKVGFIDYGAYRIDHGNIVSINQKLYTAVFNNDFVQFEIFLEELGMMRRCSKQTNREFFDFIQATTRFLRQDEYHVDPRPYLGSYVSRLKSLMSRIDIPETYLPLLKHDLLLHSCILVLRCKVGWHKYVHPLLYLGPY